jgi:hypothetical protein
MGCGRPVQVDPRRATRRGWGQIGSHEPTLEGSFRGNRLSRGHQEQLHTDQASSPSGVLAAQLGAGRCQFYFQGLRSRAVSAGVSAGVSSILGGVGRCRVSAGASSIFGVSGLGRCRPVSMLFRAAAGGSASSRCLVAADRQGITTPNGRPGDGPAGRAEVVPDRAPPDPGSPARDEDSDRADEEIADRSRRKAGRRAEGVSEVNLSGCRGRFAPGRRAVSGENERRPRSGVPSPFRVQLPFAGGLAGRQSSAKRLGGSTPNSRSLNGSPADQAVGWHSTPLIVTLA